MASRKPARQPAKKSAAAKPVKPAPVVATALPAAAPAAAGKLGSAELWNVYQAALQAQRSGDLAAARAGYIRVLQQQPDDFDVLHMLGVLETQQKNYLEALRLLKRALDIDPEQPAAHNNYGVALCAVKRFDEGIAEMRRALELDPDFHDAWSNLGRALCDTGRHAESPQYFDRAIALEPDIADIHFQRAAALDALQRRDEALAAYDRVVELNPGHAEAFCKRGHLLSLAKRFKDALVSYERAIAANPKYAEAHCNRGNALRLLGFQQEALVSVDRAIALQAGIAPAHRIRGVVLMTMNRSAEALECFDEALRLQPGYLEAMNDRGNALRQLGRYQESIQAQEQAIAVNPSAPGALANRGVALLDLGKPAQALIDFQKAIELTPQNAEFWNLRGNALQAMNRHTEAITAYSRALELQPGYAQAEFNISMCTLVRGDFVRGWPSYEARWKTGQKLGWIKFRKPLWDGKPSAGRLLAWGEQGIGDQIFHLGMLDSLIAGQRNTVVALTPRLLDIARRSFPGVNFLPLARATRERSDVQVPLGTVGGFFRRTWQEFPAGRQAYLSADETKVQALRARVRTGRAFVIGLSWASRAERFGELKSVALRELAPLLGLPGTRFIDLQYGDTEAERAAVREATGVEVMRLADIDTFNDIDGLAALIRSCDLIVTTSNTTAHLAGAVGAPTLLLLPFASGRHWYWHEGREDSPWYPSMTLYRQAPFGNWADVITRVRDAVAARMDGRTR